MSKIFVIVHKKYIRWNLLMLNHSSCFQKNLFKRISEVLSLKGHWTVKCVKKKTVSISNKIEKEQCTCIINYRTVTGWDELAMINILVKNISYYIFNIYTLQIVAKFQPFYTFFSLFFFFQYIINIISLTFSSLYLLKFVLFFSLTIFICIWISLAYYKHYVGCLKCKCQGHFTLMCAFFALELVCWNQLPSFIFELWLISIWTISSSGKLYNRYKYGDSTPFFNHLISTNMH